MSTEQLSKNFEPTTVDDKWYAHWMAKGYFKSVPDARESYTIVMPPPNVTGVLHMGHCLNNTIQDILIRNARMTGKNACWVPGTDHASIATEAKVVAMLREKGIKKSDLGREEFLTHAWEWKEKYGGIILEQLKKLGCSLDWDRTSFTMDKDYYNAVIKTFVRLHDDGIIYRGLRMVNWDPSSKTALSDEEVIYKDVDSNLYHVHYPFADGTDGGITVATTRPETIMGDVAICVHPDDERYKSIVGKEVLVPLLNRKIPIIADDYITIDFGTGALKVTPAHDKNDHELGLKYNLKVIDTLDFEGMFVSKDLLNENPSPLILGYEGMDRFALRKQIAKDIEAAGLLEKTTPYKGQVGTSERTGAVIESKLSLQWFMDMKKFLSQHPAVVDAVKNDSIKFVPNKAKNTYLHWMENIKDWCISRQLWWGQQIPAWHDESGNVHVAETLEALLQQYPELAGQKLTQDEDCLDTWFSSWLWPMEVFKGVSNPGNAELNYYYPTSTLVTGQDIIFFWVARMIMAGYDMENKQPFKDVYFTGMVRDKQGRKMSKQLGNSPDLLGLMEQYGADAVRFGILIASPAGNDILFDESALEQGRNFNNKMWNALKLLKMWEERKDASLTTDASVTFAMEWFAARLEQVKQEVAEMIKQYKLSEALKVIYSLIWNDYCSWYLEWVKPAPEASIAKETYDESQAFLQKLLQLLHPFMPFVTEEINAALNLDGGDLCVMQFGKPSAINAQRLEEGNLLQNAITTIRDVRNKQQIKPKDKIQLSVQTDRVSVYESVQNILEKQGNIEEVIYVSAPIDDAFTAIAGKDSFYIKGGGEVNVAMQKEQMQKEELHLISFLATISKKLNNEKFVANAKPEVLSLEQKKRADAEEKLEIIKQSLARLQ